MSEKHAQQTLDEIVRSMAAAGYPVEMTHKNGFGPGRIPADHYGKWDAFFEFNLASALVNGYESKSAFIALVKIVRHHAFATARSLSAAQAAELKRLAEAIAESARTVGNARFTDEAIEGRMSEARAQSLFNDKLKELSE